jgi:large subunit ribosomal protein L23
MKLSQAIIRGVQLTEKGTRLSAAENKYFLEVAPGANKIEIRQAVEKMFKVTVLKVNTLNYLGKLRRERTMRYGRRPGWKRAVVTLKPGDKIELE